MCNKIKRISSFYKKTSFERARYIEYLTKGFCKWAHSVRDNCSINQTNGALPQSKASFVLFATKTTTCYAGGKGKALARKEVTK